MILGQEYIIYLYQIPMLNKSNVVYEVNCLQCNKTYIGQTKQQLSKRMPNHNYYWKIYLANEQKTVLCSHIANADHKFALSNLKILEIESNL